MKIALRVAEGRVGQVKADRKGAARRHFSVSPILGQLNLDIAIFADCTLFVFTDTKLIMLYGFLNCFGGYALKVEAARGGAPFYQIEMGSFPFGSDGRRRSADAELYGPSIALADFSKNETQTW
jgi:hypothetical protein